MKLFCKLYSLLLHLYPAGFRRRFGEEMELVFAASMAEAERMGRRMQWAGLLREAFDLPRGLFQVYFSLPQTPLNPALEPLGPGGPPFVGPARPTWLEALLGGLPQFLLGLVAGLPLVLASAGWDSSSAVLTPILVGLLGLCILGSIVLYFRMGKPRWAAAWFFLWFIGANLLFGLVFDLFSPVHEWSEVVTYPQWSTLLALLIIYALYRIASRDRLSGLLAAVPVVMLVWSINLESVPDGPEGINWLATSLLAGLISMLLLRANRPGLGLVLVVVLTALAGLSYSYLGIYLGGMLPFSEPGPSLRAVWNSFTPILGLTAAAAIGPQLAVILREIGRGCGKLGRVAYRIALAGLLLAITAMLLIAFRLTNGSMPADMILAFSSALKIMLAGGLVIYAAGFLLLLSAMHRHQPHLIHAGVELLLFLVSLCVPIIILSILSAFGMYHTLPVWLPEFIRPDTATLTLINIWFHPVWVPLATWTALLWFKRLYPREALV